MLEISSIQGLFPYPTVTVDRHASPVPDLRKNPAKKLPVVAGC
jgi:hypothetical protein